MRMWFGLTLMALNAGKKWLLVALPVVAGVVVAGLWIGGAFSGSPAEPLAAPEFTVAPTPAPTPEPTPEPSPTRVPTSTPFPTPTAHPSPEGPTATPLPPPTPMAAPRIEVPVYLTGATNVGSLEFVLVYEPSVLDVVSVEKGALARTALIDSGSRTAGRVWTAVMDPNGIRCTGPVAVVPRGGTLGAARRERALSLRSGRAWSGGGMGQESPASGRTPPFPNCRAPSAQRPYFLQA